MPSEYGRVPGASSSAYSLRDHPSSDKGKEDVSVGRMAGLLEIGNTILRRVQGGSPRPAPTLPYRSTSGPPRWYASDDESNASGGDTDELSNSSLASSIYTAPTVAPLPRDVLRSILVLVMEMDGGLQRVPTLSLVCRYWNAVMSEQAVWGRVAQLFVPSLPLIRILRDAPTQYTFKADTKPTSLPSPSEEPPRERRRLRRQRASMEGSVANSSSMASTRVSSPVTTRSLKSSHYGPRPHSRSSSFGGGFYNEGDAQSTSYAGSMASDVLSSAMSNKNVNNYSSLFSEGGGLLADAAAAVAAVSRPEQTRCVTTRTVPTKDMVHIALAGLKSYREQRILQKMVARRRRFVLQCWGSGALFFFTAFVGSGMCALEEWDPITMCNRHVSFSFLYMSFASIFGMGISNVVMETHFEPLAFFPRVERQRQLIAASAMALLGFLVCVAWPTYWAQQNVDHIGALMQQRREGVGKVPLTADGVDGVDASQGRPYSWYQVAMPVMCALLAWQIEVVVAQKSTISEWLTQHTTAQSWRVTSLKEFTRRVFTWLVEVISHGVPLQMLISCVALAQYMETFTSGLLLVALAPTMFAMAVLMCVLYVDYNRRGQFVDGASAASLGLILCTGMWLLIADEPRGMCLMPMFLSSVGFLWCQLQTLLQVVDEAIVGAEMVGLD